MKESLLTITIILIFTFCASAQTPPECRKRAKVDTFQNHILVDPYHWLADVQNDEVLDYIKTENKYTKSVLKSSKRLEKKLLKELYSYFPKEQKNSPVWINDYWYYSEREKDNIIVYRNKDTLNQSKEIVYDYNKTIKHHKCYEIEAYDLTENNKTMAYGVDSEGNNIFDVYFKTISDQTLLLDTLFRVESMAFCSDNKTIYYTQLDTVSSRSSKIFKHVLGRPDEKDELIFYEKNIEKSVDVYKSLSDEFIFKDTGTSDENRVFYIKNNGSDTIWKEIEGYKKGVYREYNHEDGIFYLLTNDNSPNRKLMISKEGLESEDTWRELVPHRDSVILFDYSVLKDYWIISEDHFGQDKLLAIDKETKNTFYLPFLFENVSVSCEQYTDHTSNEIIVYVESYAQPLIQYVYDVGTGAKRILKEQKYNNYNPTNYVVERVWATAKDGAKIPVSVLYRKGTKKSSETPLFIESYGAYGIGHYPEFNEANLPLLERGFIWAYAHVRGGSEMGQDWYDDGRLLNKKNTFTDFIACTEHLIDKGYTSSGNIVAYGASAGGLLMGAIANMKPDLYKTIILDVPFVDVINTMSDPNLPLTTGEYIEWGNPANKEYFDYMFSYSPYDNVKEQNYPNMLFLTGLEDEQVSYWEPLKMVAKLRDKKTDDNLLLIRVEGAGHYSGGFFGYLEHFAFIQTFILNTFGIDE